MNTKKLTRNAGILYLILPLIGPLVIMVLPGLFMNQTDIITYIEENRSLLKLWILGDITIIVLEMFLTSLLFFIFNKLNKTLSMFAFMARTFMIIIMIINVFVLIALSSGIDSSNILNSLLYIHQMGTYFWEVFFFIHVLLIGYMIVKTDQIKSWIGITLMIGSFGYIFDAMYYFLELESIILNSIVMIPLLFVIVGEISFGVWLLLNKKEL